MSGFAESFWSEDYATGLTKLFAKLNQGVVENEEVVYLARRRAEAEDSHGNKLQQISRDAYRKDGFVRDDGASVRRAYEGMVKETAESGKYHCKIASNLHDMVLKPFTRWTAEHATRVQTSEKELMSRVRAHDAQTAEVKKLRSSYFNKCRLLEDFEEENKLAFPGPEAGGTPTKSPKKTPEEIAADLNAVLDDEPIELGETLYSAAQIRVLLEGILGSIVIKEVKIPILGTFQHVSTGSIIVEWIYKNMGVNSLGEAEAIGQDLVNNGFLRYLGVGSTFANSSVLNYQWKEKSLIAAGKRKPGENSIVNRAAAMPYVGDYVSTYVSNEYANETPEQRFHREASQSNETYKAGVKKLDALRTDMEAMMMEHFKFMERCELDRLRALKAVMMDVSAAISNVIPGMKSSMDTMLLFQESLSPLGDLKYMIESYRSGSFVPRVVTYENYYNSVDEQTFGVDLELRARADRKRVPNIVATILSFMDEQYPGLATDETRQKVWLRQVPLHLTHQLRQSINNGKVVERSVLSEYDLAIVAATLKLYFLELPDSLVSKSIYEPVKSIYSNYATEEDSENRILALSSILQQLRVSNIATLDAVTTHFSRLIDLTDADAEYKLALASALAPGILRPKSGSNLTHHDKHPQRLVLDLLDHKQEIFSSLKRASTTRPRSSTDEKDRRSRVEERNRAIQASGKRGVSGSHSSSVSSLRSGSLPMEIGAPPLPVTAQETVERHTRPVNGSTMRDAPFVPPEDDREDQAFDPESLELPGDVHSPPPLPVPSSLIPGQVNVLSPVTTTAPLQPVSALFQTQSQVINEQDIEIPSHRRQTRRSSLSRSVLSSHRLSRHGRTESRSLTGAETLSSQGQPNRQSVELHDGPVQYERRYELADNSSAPHEGVRGISLEDGGDVDYD